jgi:hypothetical protein
MVTTYLLLMADVLHQRRDAVLFNVVEVNLVRVFHCTLFVMLDARGAEGKVSWKDGLQPIDQKER